MGGKGKRPRNPSDTPKKDSKFTKASSKIKKAAKKALEFSPVSVAANHAANRDLSQSGESDESISDSGSVSPPFFQIPKATKSRSRSRSSSASRSSTSSQNMSAKGGVAASAAEVGGEKNKKSTEEMEVIDVEVNPESAEAILLHLQTTVQNAGSDAFQIGLLKVLTYIMREKTENEARFKKLEVANTGLQKEVDTLKAKIGRLEAGENRHEIEEAKKGILVRGVEITKEDRNGWALVEYVAEKMGFDTYSIKEVKRMPASKIMLEKAERDRENARPPIMIKFWEVNSKYNFFKGLDCLSKDAEAKRWRFCNEVPFNMRGRNLELEQAAFGIRKDKRGTKTRIAWRGDKIVLLVKPPGDREFKLHDI
jgi:hypothetical protein